MQALVEAGARLIGVGLGGIVDAAVKLVDDEGCRPRRADFGLLLRRDQRTGNKTTASNTTIESSVLRCF